MAKNELTPQQKKQIEYHVKILGALQSLFDKESENYIGLEELSEGDNATHFIHVLANTAPNALREKLDGKKMNNLEFNYMANTLCFQYAKHN